MKVTRLAALFVLMFAAVMSAAGQLVAESMNPTIDILEGSRQRSDLNGKVCAVVRVMLPVEGATFEGSVVGDTPFNTNHYWVYMPAGEKMLGINCPGTMPLRVRFSDLGISNGLQSKTIYDLILSGFPTSSSKESVTLNITVTPQNATVIIDSEIMETNGGCMSAILPEGSHQYMIAARGYLSAEGTLTLRPGRTSNFRFDLEKAAAKQQAQVSTPVPPTPSPSTSQSTSPTPAQAEQWYKEGKKYYDAKDYAKALPLFRKSAEAGNDKAQNYLGYMYEHVKGVVQDYKLAVEWYRKSAEAGNVYAQNNLGHMYYYGKGVALDYKLAVEWFRKSAEAGNAYAQNNLGYMYQYGLGVDLDYKLAVEWYRKSAEAGNASGQNDLGYMYEYEKGVALDYKLAVEWYRKSAEQGYKYAQNNLGIMYKNGRGVEQDYKLAVEWFRKAAEQGHAAAENNLGYMYEYGRGVEQDYKTAVEWYLEAMSQGYVDSAKKLLQDKFQPYLTAGQKEQVRQLLK